MKILGIETSCDETAMSVIEVMTGNKIKILSNVVSSQVKLHAKYGGVVPSLAAREHVKNIRHVFNLALKTAKIKSFGKEVDLIAVTRGPGLGPALLVGLTFAKTIAWLHQKHLIGVNHLEGHIYSNWLSVRENPKSEILNSKQIKNSKFKIQNNKIFPALNLIVSGGHTELVLMKNWFKYKIIGQTRDDAVGEAFDKVARLLGLPYPGGPEISKLAEKGKENSEIKLPRPMINSNDYDFSFAGLKTAVLYKVKKIPRLTNKTKIEIAKEFQEAVIDVLIRKTIRAVKEYKIKTVILGGGVSANKQIQEAFKKTCQKNNIQLFFPTIEMTTDNALMIAIAGYLRSIKNKTLNIKDLSAEGNLRLS